MADLNQFVHLIANWHDAADMKTRAALGYETSQSDSAQLNTAADTQRSCAWALQKVIDDIAASPDTAVEQLRTMLLNRSLVGLKKYGCTTDRTDLNLADWLHHALEESLDLAVYLRRAITELNREMDDGK